jgi:uncharacterized protein (DUF2342 family)
LRIRSRRIVWVLALLMIAAMLIACSILASKTRPVTASELDRARAAYENTLSRCESGTGSFPIAIQKGGSLDQACRNVIRPSDFLAPLGVFGLVMLPQVFQHTAFILIVIGLVIGSSSVGADWQSGSIGTLLTWESRRVRLFLVRVIVVCVWVFVLAVALLLVLSALLTLVATTRGTTAWLDSSWASDAWQTGARVAAMSAFGALLGMSISMIGRSTGAALAGVFVYLAIFESLLRAIYPKASPWLLGPNVVVFVEGIATSPGTQQVLTFAHAILVISLFSLVPFLVALVWFRSRDVGT